MYEFFSIKHVEEIDEISKEINLLNTEKENIKNQLFKNVKGFPLVNKEDINNGTLEIVKIPVSNIEKYYNIEAVKINRLTVQIKNRERFIKEKKDIFPSFKLYRFIIKRFNELLIDKLIDDAYHFKDLFIGRLSVLSFENKRKAIDWKKSRDTKNKLLSENKIPYLKKDAEQALKEGIEYKGEYWLEYLDNIGLIFSWNLTTAQVVRIPNISNYNFIPYDSRNGAIRKLNDLRKQFSEKELLEKYKKQNVN